MLTVDFSKLPIGNHTTSDEFRILDMGCGSGRHIGAAVLNSGIFAVGSDIDLSCLKETENRLKELDDMKLCSGKTALLSSDIAMLPFPDNTFDLVICCEVLEHLHDHTSAIKELLRVLKPDMHLVISVPRYTPEKICWILSKSYAFSPGGHIRIYTKKNLIRIMKSHGQIPWHCHFAHSIHTPYWWLKCLLGLHNESALPIRLYHRFLVWDLMENPVFTRMLDRYFNPIIGKSLVLYFRKNPAQPTAKHLQRSFVKRGEN